MTTEDEERRLLQGLLEATRSEAPPADLGERVLDHVAYRSRLELAAGKSRGMGRLAVALSSGLAVAASIALFVVARSPTRDLSIAAEQQHPAGSATSARPASESVPSHAPPVLDPCRERRVAAGGEPLIDDFEDGDDAVRPLEGRAGFWRWAREIDEPGTAPALIPLPRSDATRGNRLALHVKGGQLADWGATVEFNFRPTCYDASRYVGVSFQARGPGRIYVAPREVSVIPIAEGGTCDHDCHNPHVSKVDLDSAWHVYQVRWSELRQRGIKKPPLDPERLHSLAFLIRPEDTPYDVWLDEVRFLER